MTSPQPAKVPPMFKALLPFIRRAEELDRDTSRPESKLIAYYCRQYAMELGIKLRENDASTEATDYLLSLMDRLEGEKDKLPEFTQEEGKEICEDFALEIFTKADDEDRAGIANKSTARTFYAAGTFFDILNQFGDTSDDVVEKRRYCKYKAATILKAIKEGKTPIPGSPDEMDLNNVGDGNDDTLPAATSVSLTMPTPSSPRTQALKSTRSSLPHTQPLESTTLGSPPPQPLRSFPSRTDSMRSAGMMSASELDGIWHGPSSDQPPIPSLAPSHSAPSPARPTSAHSVPPVPSSEYRTQATPATPAHQAPPASNSPHRPPADPVTSAYQSPSAPSSAPELSYQSRPTSPPQSRPGHVRNTAVSQTEINDAMECAKFAIAALKVKDMKLAEERLEMALRNIRGS
uniref:Vta1/callose synthase N-terminal domain-containing protein n=1 Tax=Peronospora matthiolae TaxID=2874970 RepID=A0AAV1VLF6_9STRA